jgi:hypothetical protein
VILYLAHHIYSILGELAFGASSTIARTASNHILWTRPRRWIGVVERDGRIGSVREAWPIEIGLRVARRVILRLRSLSVLISLLSPNSSSQHALSPPLRSLRGIRPSARVFLTTPPAALLTTIPWVEWEPIAWYAHLDIISSLHIMSDQYGRQNKKSFYFI